MTNVDTPTLINWFVSGIIGLIFSIVGTWVTYRYQRKRDDAAWEREKEKLGRQFEHEKEILTLQFQKKLSELEQQALHQRKFDVLNNSWVKFHDAMGRVAQLTVRVHSYPDLNHMTEAQIKDVLKNSRLSEQQRDELLQATDKVEYYAEKMVWYDVAEAEKSLTEFHNYTVYNKIFLEADLFAQLASIDDLLSKTLIGIKVGRQAHDFKMVFEASDELNRKANPIIAEIERLIQIHSGQSVPSTAKAT